MLVRLSAHCSEIVSPISREQGLELSRQLSFYVPNYQYMPRYKYGTWDGKVRLFVRHERTFLTGLLPVITHLCGEDVEGQFSYAIPQPTVKSLSVEQWMRAVEHAIGKPAKEQIARYQLQAVKSLISYKVYSVPFPRGVIVMGTGAGKTCASGLLPFLFRDVTVLYTIHVKELAYQTKEVWERLLQEPIGLIGDSVCQPQRVTIALIQTLKARCDALKDFLAQQQIWVADEVHADATPMFLSVAPFLSSTGIRVGFSGTVLRKPLAATRLSDAQIHGLFGPKVYELPSQVLREQSLLSNVEVNILPFEHGPMSAPSFYAEYREGIVENYDRNMLILDIIQAILDRHQRVLIICNQIQHARKLLQLAALRPLRDEIAFVSGMESSAERNRVRKGLADGTIRAVLATTIFDVGVDVPDVEHLVIAAAGKGGMDGVRLIQRAGRVMRAKAHTGNRAWVWDIYDQGSCLYLQRHAKQRMKVYEEEGFMIRKHETVPAAWEG